MIRFRYDTFQIASFIVFSFLSLSYELNLSSVLFFLYFDCSKFLLINYFKSLISLIREV